MITTTNAPVKSKRAAVLDATEQHQKWMRENPLGYSEAQLLALTWDRHMFMYEDSDEGLNLVEQSFPQYNLGHVFNVSFRQR